MLYKMKLQPEPFGKIAGGEKNVELRLWDEKRSSLEIGDLIEFSCTEDGRKLLHLFNDFQNELRTQADILYGTYFKGVF